jgi:hypothetical protein
MKDLTARSVSIMISNLIVENANFKDSAQTKKACPVTGQAPLLAIIE